MQFTRLTAAAAIAAFATFPAYAQSDDAGAAETPDDAPAEAGAAPAGGELGLSTGTPITETGEAVGEAYVASEHGDWQRRCVRTEDGNDPCQLYQLIQDDNGGSVAEITVFPLPEGQEAVAGATMITPLETLLTEQLTLRVDAGSAKRYPFAFCTQAGCISRIGLTEEDLASYRAGTEAQARIVPAIAPDQEVVLRISLSGFTAGFAALSE